MNAGIQISPHILQNHTCQHEKQINSYITNIWNIGGGRDFYLYVDRQINYLKPPGTCSFSKHLL